MKASLSLRLRNSRKVRPSKRIVPELGASTFRIMRDRVVLPLPDSPMIVKISCADMVKVTSLTAWVAVRDNRPPP